ncbi:MAG: hypothetical protein ACJAUP_003604 [Cellvibrionaceae bacterium]|jgi:hypothetical protein
MTITIESQLDSTIDHLCEIKALLHQGKTDCALLKIRSLESSLYQALAVHSLEQNRHIEQITCADYPVLVLV